MPKVKPKQLKKYRRTLALYVRFVTQGSWDYSDKAAEAMFLCEALGESTLAGLIDRKNGYAIGKHWKDLTVEMWREDIAKGYLTKTELLNDSTLCSDMRPTINKLPNHPSYEIHNENS